MPKVSTNISIDADLKAEAQALFADLGLDLSTAVNIFLRQSVRTSSIPFEITRATPNTDTVAAMNEFFEMKKHPESYKSYSSFRDGMNEVLGNA